MVIPPASFATFASHSEILFETPRMVSHGAGVGGKGGSVGVGIGMGVKNQPQSQSPLKRSCVPLKPFAVCFPLSDSSNPTPYIDVLQVVMRWKQQADHQQSTRCSPHARGESPFPFPPPVDPFSLPGWLVRGCRYSDATCGVIDTDPVVEIGFVGKARSAPLPMRRD